MRFYNNERRANILLKQFQGDQETKIGEYNSIENKLMFESGGPLKWVKKHVFPSKRSFFYNKFNFLLMDII